MASPPSAGSASSALPAAAGAPCLVCSLPLEREEEDLVAITCGAKLCDVERVYHAACLSEIYEKLGPRGSGAAKNRALAFAIKQLHISGFICVHRALAPQSAQGRACEGRIERAEKLTCCKKKTPPPPPPAAAAPRAKPAMQPRPKVPALPRKSSYALPARALQSNSAPHPVAAEPAAPIGPREVPGAEWAPARSERAPPPPPPPQPALPALLRPQPAPAQSRSSDAAFEGSWAHLAPPTGFFEPPQPAMPPALPPPWHDAANGGTAAALPAAVKTELDACVAAGVFAPADVDAAAYDTLLRSGAELSLLVLGQLPAGTGAGVGALIAQHAATLAPLVAPTPLRHPAPSPPRVALPPPPPMSPPFSLFASAGALPPASMLLPLPWLAEDDAASPVASQLPPLPGTSPLSVLPPPAALAPREYRPAEIADAHADAAAGGGAHVAEMAQLRAELAAVRAEAASLRALVARQHEELQHMSVRA